MGGAPDLKSTDSPRPQMVETKSRQAQTEAQAIKYKLEIKPQLQRKEGREAGPRSPGGIFILFHKLIHIRQIQDVGYITGREAAHPTPDRWVALAIVLPNSQLRC